MQEQLLSTRGDGSWALLILVVVTGRLLEGEPTVSGTRFPMHTNVLPVGHTSLPVAMDLPGRVGLEVDVSTREILGNPGRNSFPVSLSNFVGSTLSKTHTIHSRWLVHRDLPPSRV
eukprot:306707-Rhodomonas_salina.1